MSQNRQVKRRKRRSPVAHAIAINRPRRQIIQSARAYKRRDKHAVRRQGYEET
jgi:hypothetical protein